MKKISLTILLFFVATLVFAADKEGSKKVCDTQVLPINLGEDVVGIELVPAGGQWVEVSPTDDTQILNANASNVFRAIDKHPGTYVFIYKAKNNLCMEDGKTAKATVEILETPKDVNIDLFLCKDQTKELDLKMYISSTLKAKYPSDLVYKKADGTEITNGLYNITAQDNGTIKLEYEISNPPADYICNTKASIVVNVRREADFSGDTFGGEKSYCITALPQSVNLNNLLGIGAIKDGVWEAKTTGAPTITDGVITFDAGVTKGDYTYTFKFPADIECGLAGKTADYIIKITDDLSSAFTDNNLAICKKNSPNDKIDMLDALKVGIPISSGIWSEVDGYTNPTVIDIKSGYFDVSKATSGEYKYQFKVSDAVEMCGIDGIARILTLNIENGGDLFDGEVQLCSENRPTALNLSKYIAGLTPTTTVKWVDASGTEITSGVLDASGLAAGTYKYTYETGSSECKAQGNLYVSVVDKLTNYGNKTVKYCLTDNGSNSIDLDEILGVAGLEGTWKEPAETSSNYDATTHIFNGKAQGVGEYQFIFTPTTGGCGVDTSNTATITVKITKDLIN